jgi:hypothetical protein
MFFLRGRNCICFELMSHVEIIPQYIESTHTGCLQSVVNHWNRKISYRKIFFFSRVSTALVGLGLLYEVPRSHSDTPYSVGLLWTSDRSVVETSTIQRITITRGRHHYWGFNITSDTSHLVGNPWTSDRSAAQISTLQHTKITRGKYPCPRREFERAIHASERPKIHTLDSVATGIDLPKYRSIQPQFGNKPTKWTSLWDPLFHYELRMLLNRKRSDFVECYVKKSYWNSWHRTYVTQPAL